MSYANKIAVFTLLGFFAFGLVTVVIFCDPLESCHDSRPLKTLARFHTAVRSQNTDALVSLIGEEISVKSKFEDRVLSKQELIERISEKRLKITGLNVRYESCRLEGDLAAVRTEESIIIEIDGGRNLGQTAEYQYTLRRNNEMWVISGIELLKVRL